LRFFGVAQDDKILKCISARLKLRPFKASFGYSRPHLPRERKCVAHPAIGNAVADGAMALKIQSWLAKF
jgi:hypothetical protein